VIERGAWFRNNKTGSVYRVLDKATDATNATDGRSMVIYKPARPVADSRPLYVREEKEFLEKFTQLHPLLADDDED
jgi:hypothetical protein